MALDRRVDRLEELLERLTAAVLRLAEAQVRTEERLGRLEEVVARLAEAQVRTEERLGRLEEVVARLAEAQVRTEERLGRLEEVVARLTEAQARTDQQVAALRGADLERRYREHAAAYFQRLVREPRLVPNEELARLVDAAERRGAVSAAEREQVLWADVVVAGRLRERETETYLLVEVSATIDVDDVQRASERARILHRATGLPAIAVVAGERITAEAERQAAGLAVWRVLDGRAYRPDEASPQVQG
jgi:tetratricopeptide (TPR) repeat protein